MSRRGFLVEQIESKIFLIQGQKVMLDSDLAELYHVTTKRLNEQVRRNVSRFPLDFMFRLTQREYDSLRSQIATLKIGQGRHRKYLPCVFTEQGVAMLSSVLKSKRAVQANIAIMRVFVKLRRVLSTHRQLVQKLAEFERKLENHDGQIRSIFEVIRQLMTPSRISHRRIGFHTD